MDLSGLTPPPPIPRRVLTYDPRNPSPHPLQAADTRTRTGSTTSVNSISGTTAPRPGSVSDSTMSGLGCVMPGTPGTDSCRNLQTPSSAGANPACQSTLCFHDHQGHLAIMVPGPETSYTQSAVTEPSSAETSGYRDPSNRTESSIPNTQGLTAHGPSKHDRPQVTVQLYLHSHLRAFNNEKNLRNVDQWCRHLQCSTAFQYLKHKLSQHGAFGGLAPTVRIEAYDALHTYKVWNFPAIEIQYQQLSTGHHQSFVE